MVEALQTRNHQPVFLVGRYHDVTVKVVVTGLRSVDNDDVAVMNQRHHGTASNPQATGGAWVRTPVTGSGQHGFGRDLTKLVDRISGTAMGSRNNRQKGNGHQFIRAPWSPAGSGL